MDTFAWAESPGSSLEETPRVNTTQFGDGYSQRTPDGLNPLAQAHRLVFKGTGRIGGDAIVAFLRAHKDGLAFLWTPMWEAQPIKVICTTWTRTALDEPDESDISATFTQVFEP